MLNEKLVLIKLKRYLSIGFSYCHRLGNRTLLSQAYRCDEAWAKRLESPLVKNINLDHYFSLIDSRFNSKNLPSAVDIDLFAISVQDDSQLDEIEHLLYRFRKTKRASEMLDSTICAVIRVFLESKNYEALIHILRNAESYGTFPDCYLYNIVLDTLIEEKLFKEAAQVAVLMMLQEDFSNEISRFLAVYSCHLFLKNHSLDTLYPKPEVVEVVEDEEDDGEEKLVRVPFLRNPWFDDHFDLIESRHLVGKTFYLAGREMKEDLLGKTLQLLGMGMYEKWESAWEFLNSLAQSKFPVLLSEGVEEFKKYMESVPTEDMKVKFEDLFKKMQEGNKIECGDLEHHLNLKIPELLALEKQDIESQERLFTAWEQERQLAVRKQNLQLEKEQRLEVIAKKKEYLIWKEKHLFFFENEDMILQKFQEAEEITSEIKGKQSEDVTYVPPEISNLPTARRTKYEKLARVKKL